jgi:hypothetical protein
METTKMSESFVFEEFAVCLSRYTLLHLVYILAKETFFIEDLTQATASIFKRLWRVVGSGKNFTPWKQWSVVSGWKKIANYGM